MALRNTFNSAARRMKSSFSHSYKRLHSSGPVSEENITRYCVGGYHPVRIGDLFRDGKYKIISKLGYGVYSTVWLAFDLESERHVALKILTADSFGHGNDTFEIDILKRIRSEIASDPGRHHILPLLDNFKHDGPNGNHACLVFPAMGPDMSKYRRLFPNLRIPLPLMKDISRQFLLALSYLHDTCQVIHTVSDIKPQNILIQTSAIKNMFKHAPSEAFKPDSLALPPPLDFYTESAQVSSAEEDLAHSTDISIMLADFGTASWFERHLTEWIQPQMLRAPEVILEANWDHKVDVWNLGLIIWELAEGRLLFDGMWTPSGPYSPEAHLAQITAVFGSIPRPLLDRSKNRHRYFDTDGKLLKPSAFPPCSLEQFSKNPDLSGAEKKSFLHFIRSMVRTDPEERLDARKLLESPWLA
ncbi:serine/threonine protein kinase domain protein [Metarhizium robertsii]|uniref:non-specific serine/threonine protein kinase n=1 Tax=Metarhizium robertsii TaxID=568076 RepID=A0A0A1UQP3_9HYPO|nr:serine/threonine protein kinase domain protein [Metarhizium robertsii]